MAQRLRKYTRGEEEIKNNIDIDTTDKESIDYLLASIIKKIDNINDDIAELFSLHARR